MVRRMPPKNPHAVNIVEVTRRTLPITRRRLRVRRYSFENRRPLDCAHDSVISVCAPLRARLKCVAFPPEAGSKNPACCRQPGVSMKCRNLKFVAKPAVAQNPVALIHMAFVRCLLDSTRPFSCASPRSVAVGGPAPVMGRRKAHHSLVMSPLIWWSGCEAPNGVGPSVLRHAPSTIACCSSRRRL